MSITLFTGRPRQGKTYLAVKEIFSRLREGEIVYSNILLNWNGDYENKTLWRRFLKLIGIKKNWYYYPAENVKYWKRLDDLYHVERCTILMDEAHVYMRSRKWESLPEEMEKKLSQHGKNRIDIIATTQHQDRIDKIMREIVDYWYVCVKTWVFFERWEFDIDGDKMKKNPLSRKRYWKSKKGFLLYDSYSPVDVGQVGKAIFEIQDGF